MPRGKCTNVKMICQNKIADRKVQTNRGRHKRKEVGRDEKCEMQNATTRINKKTHKSLERMRYCNTCQAHTLHKNGSEIKHSSGK